MNVTSPEICSGCRCPPSSHFTDFKPLSCHELMMILQKYSTKSCILDPIPKWLLKRRVPMFVPKLTELINFSFSAGVFLSALCDAAVTPILKNPSLNNKNEMKNYRPISNIRFLGKVIEKVVSSQLKSYIDANGFAEPMRNSYFQESKLSSKIHESIFK